MNQLSQIARKFNRFELKYLISLQQAERVKSVLRAYMASDEHGSGSGRYALANLYYDSPDFRCYWEKMDGIRLRRKLRLRRYDNDQPLAAETPIFVEIKQRLDRVTQKRRVLLPYASALQLCDQREMPDHAPDEQAVMEEIYAFIWNYNLRPARLIRYERQALIGTQYDPGLRVTFDTNLIYQITPLALHEEPAGLPLIPADQVVMEIKVNERIPHWLTELVGAHHLKMVRFSKYCHSVHQPAGFLTNVVRP